MASDCLPATWRGVLACVLAWAGLAVGMGNAAAAVPEVPRLGLVDGSAGLPSTEIAGIAQDREGYLWLATGDGLARYDGAGFKVWRHDPADPASLPGNSLQALYIDGQDRIWVAAEGRGVSVLDAARQHFRHFRSGHPAQLRDEGVFALAGRGAEVWFGTQGGELYRIGADGQVRRFELDHLLPPDSLHVMALAADPAGNLWIGTTAGLLRHDGQRLVREPMPVEDGIFALAWIDDQLWVSSASGIAQRDRQGHWHLPPWSRRFSSRAGNIAWSMAAAGDGEYWLGTERGLWRTHGDAEPEPAVADQVPVSRRRNVMALLRGDDGGLWVPLHGSGLGYLRADWKRTAVLPLAADLGDGVYCPLMQASGGGLWQIDGGRLSRLDTATGVGQVLPWTPPALRDMLVTAGLEDRRGRLWLGNYTNGLARIDLRTGQYRDWVGGTPEYGAPTWIVEDARGEIWLGVINTLQRRAGDSGALIDSYAAGRDKRLQGGQVSQLGLGPDGEAWVATSSGLQAWQPARDRFEPVPGMTGEAVDLFEVTADGVWTYRLGELEHWHQVAGRWQRQRRLDHLDGVPATEAMDLRVDERGRLWLATRRGLWRLDPAASGSQVARGYGLRDGLSSPEFIRGCLRMDAGGVLAGATDDGNLLLVDTRMPDPAPETPPLRIEEVSVLRDGHRENLSASGEQQLRSDDRQLRVVARLLAFGGGQGVRYRWRMLGLDDAWSERDGPGLQEFAVLPAGDYVLQVQGIDALGNASTVHQLRFGMPPPWWRSGTGLALWGVLVAMLALAGALVYRQRLRARHAWQLAQHKRELAEQASSAKSHFLATLGHEVRTPMTGVLGMTELLLQTPLDARQHDYASAIDVAGRHLLRLVNDALDLARIEAGKLSLEQHRFDPRQLVRQVAALARPLAVRKGLDFLVVVDPALPEHLLGDPDRVQQILSNLLGNAVKFTEHGRVELHAAAGADGHGVMFEIRDTGPGLSQEQQSRLFRRFEQADGAHTRARYGGSGLGLAICRELATAMGGAVRMESAAGQGTRFRVELPLPACADAVAETVPVDAPPAATEPLHVLLVEDDDTVSRVITGLLEARGHRVTRVAHGLAALAELDVQDFDVGLFDLDLPGIDGLALVRQLRQMGQALPVFAVTARSDPQAQPLALAAGCTGFLRKPVTGAALAQALASLQPVAAGTPS